MLNTRTLIALGLSVLVAACTTTKTSAPVVDRAPPQARPRPAQPPAANASTPVASPTTAQKGFYTVRRGDTLVRIAQEFGQNLRDLVSWNNLSSPNDIKVDQVLRVLPPEATPPVAGGPTNAVPVNPGVEVRPLGPAAAAAPVKTGPRGDKRPWSEANLAELQKPEGAVNAPGKPEAKTEAKPEPAKPAEATASAADLLDLVWPTDGKLVASFDAKRKGIDISGKLGQPVLAASGGQVSYVGSMRGYGNLVIVRHNENFLSAYAHNKTIVVKEGQTVARGQKIAEMGNTDSDSVKLHFEVRQQGKPVDPTKYLPSR
jgi:lipoprotein NlpD